MAASHKSGQVSRRVQGRSEASPAGGPRMPFSAPAAGGLVVVGTPIGNLGDLSPRAKEALAHADVVAAEDTRVTGGLLAKVGVTARLERCDENVIARRAPALVERMQAGETVAFCSDAGMPGVSDPGAVLVDACQKAGVPVEVVPGPTALATAIAASGFATTAFYFGGFLPRKAREQQELLQSLSALDACLVFYESPHRAASTLAVMAEVFDGREACLCRELTKLHEEVLRAPVAELARQVAGREGLKGEVVLVVGPPAHGSRRPDLQSPEVAARARELLAQGASPSRAARVLASELGVSKNAVYDLVRGLAEQD